MPGNNTIGTAYVQVLPSTEGIEAQLSQQMGVAGDAAGKVAGQQAGAGLAGSLGGVLKGAAVVGAIAGTAKGINDAFNEVDAGLDTIIQKTGASGDTLSGFQDAMESIAMSIPTDFGTAGEAVGEVSTRFGLTGDALEELSGQFVKFAQINGTDVTGSVDDVQKALSAFGMTAEDAGGMLDVLTKVGQDTGVSVDTLTKGLIQNGTAFQEMGLSADQAAVFMGQMEKSGANSETVMNGLRKALKAAAADGKPMNEALQELQNSILNGTDGMDGLTAAYDLFGKSGDQIYGAVKNGTLDFSNLAAIAIDAGGAVSDTFEATLDPADRMQAALNGLKVVGADVGAAIFTELTPVIEGIGEAMPRIVDFWESTLSPTIGGIIDSLRPLIDVTLELLGDLFGVEEGSDTLGQVLDILAAAFQAVGDVVGWLVEILAPIIEVIGGAIVDSIQSAIYAVQNWDQIWADFGAALKALWDGIVGWASETWQGISDTITAAIDTAATFVRETWESISDFLHLDDIVATVTDIWDGVRAAIEDPIGTARDFIGDAISAIKGFFDFDISWPNIPMPHFYISPAGWDVGDLLQGSIPSLGIEWYASGGIMTRPTIFGGGEAGSEGIIPLDPFWDRLDSLEQRLLAAQAAGTAPAPIYATLYAYPSGPKMDEWIVDSYDRGKRRHG